MTLISLGAIIQPPTEQRRVDSTSGRANGRYLLLSTLFPTASILIFPSGEESMPLTQQSLLYYHIIVE